MGLTDNVNFILVPKSEFEESLGKEVKKIVEEQKTAGQKIAKEKTAVKGEDEPDYLKNQPDFIKEMVKKWDETPSKWAKGVEMFAHIFDDVSEQDSDKQPGD